MKLTEEKKNANFVLWTNKLKNYNCYSGSLINDYGEKLTHGSFNMNEINGGCYDGALIDVILNHLCTIGYHINELAFGTGTNGKTRHPYLNVNTEMLMRVLLLQHISKADYFVPTREQWKKSKGFSYDFNEDIQTQLKAGERSVYMCTKYGIRLNEDEFEAMMIIDKEQKLPNSHQTPLSAMTRIANQLTLIELQKKYNYEKSLLTD